MKRILALLLAFLCLPALDAPAQGIVLERIVVEPPRPTPPPRGRLPIRLVEHRFRILVEDQVAHTEVTQLFHNPNPWEIEGVYLFPLPEGAAVSAFTMRMGDRQVPGEVLDSDKAREIYLSIVRRRRDPGLLEFAGRGLIRARLFPIPARGDVKVTLSFGQVLRPDGGMIELVHPLRSDRFSPGAVNVSGEIEIRAQAGLATLFSPTHALDVVRKAEDHVVASFEATRFAGDRDFRALYSLGRKDFGLALTTHRPAAEDGYFLLLVAPHRGLEGAEVLPKDIVFVIDTSGSMGDRGGKKIRQAKAALSYALGRLREQDRFNVVAFSTEARTFRDQILPATRPNVDAALAFVDGLQATGGTAIHDALLEALRLERVEGRVPIVIFLTDGQPTIGPTEPKTILHAVQGANKAQARLFVFGVGDDVNTLLLTELADKNRGAGNFVAESEDIEIKVSSLYDKVAHPVLTDVSLEIEGAGVHDVYPRHPGDLFMGQQVVVVGRYRNPGPRAVRLDGKVGARAVSFVYEGTFGEQAGQEFLPRLWAVRKVGYLMGEIRRNGEKQELVDEVRRLGTRYGIVTPYTSFLVVEEGELLRRRIAQAPADAGEGGAPGAPSVRAELQRELWALEADAEEMDEARKAFGGGRAAGRGAVRGARDSVRYHEAKRPDEVTGRGVRTVEDKTFRFQDGVWVDTGYEEFLARHPQAEVVRVTYLGEEYLGLLADDALARYLSVGPCVRLVHGGKVYEVVEG